MSQVVKAVGPSYLSGLLLLLIAVIIDHGVGRGSQLFQKRRGLPASLSARRLTRRKSQIEDPQIRVATVHDLVAAAT